MQTENKQKLLLLGKIILFLITFLVATSLCYYIIELIPEHKIYHPLLFIIKDGVNILIGFAILALFVKIIDKEKFISSYWFSLKGHVKGFFTGGLLGGICIVFGFLIIINLNWHQVEIAPLQIHYLSESLFLIFCIALLEEMLFRGYVFRKLLEKFSPLVSLLLSSLIFTGLHCTNPSINFLSIINIFLAGLLLGMLFLHTKNIWLATGFHFLWNYIQAALGFNVSGVEFPAILYLTFESESLFNGGYFGFEGSYVCSIILLMVLFLYYKKNKQMAFNKQ